MTGAGQELFHLSWESWLMHDDDDADDLWYRVSVRYEAMFGERMYA